MTISLEKISKIISEKMGDKIQIIECKPLLGGHEAESFKLTDKNGKKFFLKQVKQKSYYKLRPEQSICWFLLSDAMMRSSPVSSDGLGVVIQNGNNYHLLPSLNSESEVFHLQNFEELSEKNYWETLNSRKNKEDVSEEDIKETQGIANLLFSIHNTSRNLGDEETKNRLYNDSLYSVFTAQDLFFFFLHTFPENHPFMPPMRHGGYTAEMIKLFHKFKDSGKRLRTLHGDFWGTNVYQKKDGSWYAIDYSRIPLGEPGIDIASWIAQYLWLYHETKNKYFRQLGEEFLKQYEKISGDKDIRIFSSFPLGLLGLIYISPYLYPDRTGPNSKSFLDNILKILKNGKFTWE